MSKEVQKQPLDSWYLENRKDNHYKFYQIELLEADPGYLVRMTWGKIGSKGTSKNEFFLNKSTAKSTAETIYLNKKSRGYSQTAKYRDTDQMKTDQIEKKKKKPSVNARFTKLSLDL